VTHGFPIDDFFMCGRIMTGSVWRGVAFTILTAGPVVFLLHCKVAQGSRSVQMCRQVLTAGRKIAYFTDFPAFSDSAMPRRSLVRSAFLPAAACPSVRSPLAAALLALVLVMPAQAQQEAGDQAPTAVSFDEATRATLVEQAKNLRDQAEQMKNDAEARFTRDDAACYQKFLTNECRDKAKKARSQSIADSRQLESEARAIDRRVRLRDAQAHEQERREALPQRAREQAEQARKFREAQEQAESARTKRQADKQHAPGAPAASPTSKAVPGSDAAAAEARARDIEETQKRMAERDKRAAEKAAERAKKEAARVAGD
jgi:hypothetical protein